MSNLILKYSSLQSPLLGLIISFTTNTISIGKGKWIGVFLERGEPNTVQVFERISNNPQSVTDEDCMVIELFKLLAYKARPGLDWTYARWPIRPLSS